MESEEVKSVLAITLMLSGCAAQADLASPPPEWAVRIINETHKRVIVEHQDWYARDFRNVPAGQEVWGNCATFAFTASILANQAGHPANIVQHGPGHVIAVAGGWAFDAQAGQPYPANP